MKKQLKRIGALALALAFALCLMLPAFATEVVTEQTGTDDNTSSENTSQTGSESSYDADTGTGTGSITVSNATKDKSYKVYQIFTARLGLATADTDAPISYIATEAQQELFSSKVGEQESPFTFTQIKNTTGLGSAKAYYYVTVNGKEDDVIKYIKAVYQDENNEAAFGEGAACPLVAEAKAEGNEVDIEAIPYGYYLITSGLGAIVAVNSNHPNVTVVDKDETPTWPATTPTPTPSPDPDDPLPANPGKAIVVEPKASTAPTSTTSETPATSETPESKATNEVTGDDAGASGNTTPTPATSETPATQENTNTDTSTTEYYTAKSFNFGDTVKYEITFTATNFYDALRVEKYFINDSMPTGLALDEDSVEVYVGETKLDTAKDQYVFNKGTQKPGNFQITIPWATAKTDKADAKSYYDSPSVIRVTYSATVENTATIAGSGNTNTATFAYKTLDENDKTVEGEDPDPDNPPEEKGPYHVSESKKATVYVFALAIQKVDEDGAPLANAHFEVKLGGKGISAVEDAENPGHYTYSSSSAEGSTTDFVSNEDGIIEIVGVEGGEYTVTETRAPAGYNLLTESPTIEASIAKAEQYTYITKDVYYNSEDEEITKAEYDKLIQEAQEKNEKISDKELDEVAVSTKEQTTQNPVSYTQVKNTAGTLLPSTGGMGTKLFYIIGAALLIGAGVLLVVRRRMGDEE